MHNFKGYFSGLIGTFFSFFGILAVPLALLIPCNVIDYFTGMAASKKKGERITSKRGYEGIVKKISMYILIFVGFGMDVMIGYATSTLNIQLEFPMLFSAIIASWLVINELISITENCEELGSYVPVLSPVLKIIKRKIEISVDVKEGEEYDSKF